MKRYHISSRPIDTKLKLYKKKTYIGLPMETHSNLRYCPSCGIISECVISRWGASAKKKEIPTL